MVGQNDDLFIRSIRSGYGMGIRFMGKCGDAQSGRLHLCIMEPVQDFRLVKERRTVKRE